MASDMCIWRAQSHFDDELGWEGAHLMLVGPLMEGPEVVSYFL